jgi:hypothetical protein
VIKLHELAAELGNERMKTQELMIPLKLLPNSALRTVVTTRLLRSERGAGNNDNDYSRYNDDDDDDETMSDSSFSSGNSMIGASFSFDSRSPNPLSGVSRDHYLNPGQGIKSSSQEREQGNDSRTRPQSLQRTTYLTDEEEEEPMTLNSVDEDQDFPTAKLSSMSLSAKSRNSRKERVQSARTKISRLSAGSSNPISAIGSSSPTNAQSSSSSLLNRKSAKGMPDAESIQRELNSRQEERIQANEETFNLYQKEVGIV